MLSNGGVDEAHISEDLGGIGDTLDGLSEGK